ncbi:MAG: ABC transporter ATP-binding protein [Methylohalobius sp. ZOD2]
MRQIDTLMWLDNVSMDYTLRSLFGKSRRFHALKGINLELRKGETLGVMGRNGCGKSSLLRILAGVVEPTSGRLRIPQPVTRALLTLGLGFNRELSGRDNALLSAMLQGYSRKDARALLPQIQEYSELGDFFDQPVKTYSSGMRSKLGFATAIIVNVDILLIDETLSVGDSQFKKKAEETMLARIHGDQTVVFVSHQAGQVKRVCQRAIWLEKGQIRAEGEINQVSERYDNFMKRHQQAA